MRQVPVAHRADKRDDAADAGGQYSARFEVTDGKATRGAKCRLVRDGTIVYEGEIASLRRFNDDVREVLTGFEYGVVLKDYMDVKEGDQIEVFETRQVERTLS